MPACLRNRSTATDPILLRINPEAGHVGASGRLDYLKEPATVQAFALWAMKKRDGRT